MNETGKDIEVGAWKRGVMDEAGDNVYVVKIVKVTDKDKDKSTRPPVFADLRRKGVCHYEVVGTGQIVKARKDCQHLRLKTA